MIMNDTDNSVLLIRLETLFIIPCAEVYMKTYFFWKLLLTKQVTILFLIMLSIMVTN